MTMQSGDQPQGLIAAIVEKRDSAIAAHEELRKSPPFAAAVKGTEQLVGDYALASSAVSLMSTRWPAFKERLLTLRIYDLLLESAISTLGLIRQGLFNPAKREMRFLIEASVKAWRFDADEAAGTVSDKLANLDDVRERFRELVDHLEPRLLDEQTARALTHRITNLYGELCTYVHPSSRAFGVHLRKFERGEYLGFETIDDINKINELFADVLDLSLAALFESFDTGLLGDIFVEVLDDQAKWSFHRTALVKSISSHFDYKIERRR
jgi:hypothetical protein